MKATAPGKLILSGEHSVVYGAPAIATAVAQKATAFFLPEPGTQLDIYSDVLGNHSLPISDLLLEKQDIDDRYRAFANSDIAIDQVLHHPLQLIIYCLAYAGFNQTGKLVLDSDIPPGSGMGSSAAVIAAVLRMAGIQEAPEFFVKTVCFCERLQHGRGSIIDASAVSMGGVIKVESGAAIKLDVELGEGWYVWDSGKPDSNTGQTVAYVREKYALSAIWNDFSVVTLGLIDAIRNQDRQLLKRLISENQRLLNQIGVVPPAVQSVIEKIQKLGGAAKICGAGSMRGDFGGQVLVYLPDHDLDQISQKMNIVLSPLETTKEGAFATND